MTSDAELDLMYERYSDGLFRQKWEPGCEDCSNCFWYRGCECDLHHNRPEYGICDDYIREVP